MGGAIPPLPLHAFIICTWPTLTLLLIKGEGHCVMRSFVMHVSRRVLRLLLRSIQGRQDWRGMQHAYGRGGIQNGSRKTEQKKTTC